jgi:hypothetical protein
MIASTFPVVMGCFAARIADATQRCISAGSWPLVSAKLSNGLAIQDRETPDPSCESVEYDIWKRPVAKKSIGHCTSCRPFTRRPGAVGPPAPKPKSLTAALWNNEDRLKIWRTSRAAVHSASIWLLDRKICGAQARFNRANS